MSPEQPRQTDAERIAEGLKKWWDDPEDLSRVSDEVAQLIAVQLATPGGALYRFGMTDEFNCPALEAELRVLGPKRHNQQTAERLNALIHYVVTRDMDGLTDDDV